MSPRKPTIDDLDDEDGIVKEEKTQATDLDLTIADAEDVATVLPPELEQEEER